LGAGQRGLNLGDRHWLAGPQQQLQHIGLEGRQAMAAYVAASLVHRRPSKSRLPPAVSAARTIAKTPPQEAKNV
jgi:hypothetical protein